MWVRWFSSNALKYHFKWRCSHLCYAWRWIGPHSMFYARFYVVYAIKRSNSIMWCVCFSSKFFVRGIWKLLSFVLNDSIYEFVGMIYTTESSLCRSKFSEKHPTQCCALYFCQGSMCAGDSSHCNNIYLGWDGAFWDSTPSSFDLSISCINKKGRNILKRKQTCVHL